MLRHWEDEGLLSPARTVGGRRVYAAGDETRVAEILIGKDAGFTLEDLRELFAAPGRERRRAVLRGQLAEVQRRIARLSLSRTLLEHGLRCEHEDYQQCPRFREMVLSRIDGGDLASALDHH